MADFQLHRVSELDLLIYSKKEPDCDTAPLCYFKERQLDACPERFTRLEPTTGKNGETTFASFDSDVSIVQTQEDINACLNSCWPNASYFYNCKSRFTINSDGKEQIRNMSTDAENNASRWWNAEEKTPSCWIKAVYYGDANKDGLNDLFVFTGEEQCNYDNKFYSGCGGMYILFGYEPGDELVPGYSPNAEADNCDEYWVERENNGNDQKDYGGCSVGGFHRGGNDPVTKFANSLIMAVIDMFD